MPEVTGTPVEMRLRRPPGDGPARPPAGRTRYWMRRTVVITLALVVVALATDNLVSWARLDHAQSAVASVRAGLARTDGALHSSTVQVSHTDHAIALLGQADGVASDQLGTVQQQLAVTSEGVDIQGYAASTLSSCLAGVDQTFGELSQGDQASAAGTIDSVAAPCLSLEGSGAGGPVYPFDLADPSILVVGSTYYAYGTNDVVGNVQVLSSPDLAHWTAVGNALPQLPAWAQAGDTWAPDVIALNGQYSLFYTVKAAATGQQCISVATSTSPVGPFVDASAGPLVCQQTMGGSIDPDPFVDADGTPYLVWKSQGTTGAAPTIWSEQLAPDGSSTAGPPVALLQPDQAWEGGIVEAPSLALVNGTYYLFFSGNNWDSASYAVGVAVCTGPAGPCTEPLGGPILASGSGLAGPGSTSVFTDTGGQVELAFDAYLPDAVGYPHSRLLFLRSLSFSGGLPSVETTA